MFRLQSLPPPSSDWSRQDHLVLTTCWIEVEFGVEKKNQIPEKGDVGYTPLPPGFYFPANHSVVLWILALIVLLWDVIYP
jgi:hypothetical protein